jgi:hypothetical protein
LKDSDYFAERTLELFKSKQSSPWPDLTKDRGKGSGVLARGVTGGVGPGVEEHKEVDMDLGRRSGGAGVVGGRPATEFCFGRQRSGLVMAVMFWHAGG